MFVAGWNIPGYLPDYPPEEFDTFESAFEYISDAVAADDENPEVPYETVAENQRKLSAAAENGAPMECQIREFVYFIHTA